MMVLLTELTKVKRISIYWGHKNTQKCAARSAAAIQIQKNIIKI